MKGMYEYDDEDEDGDDTPKEPAPPEEGSFQAASLGKRAAIIFAEYWTVVNGFFREIIFSFSSR